MNMNDYATGMERQAAINKTLIRNLAPSVAVRMDADIESILEAREAEETFNLVSAMNSLKELIGREKTLDVVAAELKSVMSK
jgi:hypothetical protein